ncbi:MAG: carbohydrate-binding domain-containing protein [Kiritimatiellae bacterium]|nr:carbohydrate-binding domain-containing protein [Kiritimatiellia bacterium]
MHFQRLFLSSIALFLAETGIAAASERPELYAFPFKTAVESAGDYVADGIGQDFVLSGEISGDVAISGTELFRVTLSNATVSGTLTLVGDAQLWLIGENTIIATSPSAVTSSAALTVGGPGSLAASAPGGKKVGVISAVDLTLAGGDTTLTIADPTTKNACGVSLSGNYTQLAGSLSIVGGSDDVKQNGIFLSKKKTTAAISGGTLTVTLAGEKSVGLALDKDTCAATISGGVLRFAMSGDGAKGIKGDGSITMTGGLVDATLTGGYAEDFYTYEDDDEVEWSYYVTLSSTNKTSGGTSAYSTTSLIANGTYPVMDPSKSYGIKGGTITISGGTVRIRATGTAGRGIGGDFVSISGGAFDIEVSGGPTDVYVQKLSEDDPADLRTVLDSGSAACLKTSGSSSVLSITGGTFELAATGPAGKLINAAGSLVIGTAGAVTLPTDASFSPDIHGSTSGEKVYCTAVKQKYYGTLATAVATTNLDDFTLSVAADNLVQTSSGGGGPGGGVGPGGGNEDADYSNPKGIKAETGVAMHSGRLRVVTAKDGGEGFESKADMTIDGGLLEFVCADDCINTAGNLTIDGGWIYAVSTGNDGIDSNGNIVINGGVILAFTTTSPECGMDTDSSTGILINGGTVVSFGSATQMAYGSSGTQPSYRSTSVSASTYAGKYLVLSPGSATVYVKVPSMTSTSGSLSLVCSNDGWTSSKTPTTATAAPSSGDTGFHGVHIVE